MKSLTSKFDPEMILRAALVVSGSAYVARMLLVEESPLFSWFWSPRDVGGLGWGEGAALATTQGIAIALGVATVVVAWRPWPVVLGGIFLFQLAWATAMSQKQEGFPIDLVAWDETPLAPLAALLPYVFPYLTEAARMATPLVLWRMVVARRDGSRGGGYSPSAEWLARVGIATTFAAHGIESLAHYPTFVDMLIVASKNLGLPVLSESSAASLLTLIGGIDLVLAALVLVARWRVVAGYMAAWGLITSAARVVTQPWDLGWIEAAVRTAHFALPFVLLVWWLKDSPVGGASSEASTEDSA